MNRTIMFDTIVKRFYTDGSIDAGCELGPFCVSYDTETLKIECVTLDVLRSCVVVTEMKDIEIAVLFLGGRDHVRKEIAEDYANYCAEAGIDPNGARAAAYEARLRREHRAGF